LLPTAALEQVLANLISNAIKYNRDHGRVTITVECAESRIRIAVADDGRGLSPAECTLLFMPFNRLGAERSRTEGTGLDLPRAEGAAGIQPIPEMAPPPVPDARAAPAPRRSSRCVLYVEDDEFNRLLLSQVFADRTDWQLHLAGSVAEGVDMATRLRPDLILADMNLPDGHGIDLIARVHHALPAHPVRMAALSADALPQQIEAALSAGFERYWTKPVDLTLLLAWLDDILA
jgi:CheY-like chemotaxis protein